MRVFTLNDYAVPVCEFDLDGEIASIKHLFGTAFFISGDGLFLTATHVAEKIKPEAGRNFGILMRDIDDASKSFVSTIDEMNNKGGEFDVTIGNINLKTNSLFRMEKDFYVESWQDVETFGYPDSAVNREASRLLINCRVSKGFIQRELGPGDLPKPWQSPPAFEVNFPITVGMSGSPLFVGEVNNSPRLIGMCIASFKSDVLEYYVQEYNEADGKGYAEKVMRAEHYGIAHDIRALAEWSPPLLKGKALKDVMQVSILERDV